MSTGPKTEAGKARSLQNAWKHGSSAELLLVVGKCAHNIDEFRDELMRHHSPQSVFEAELLGRLAGILWRLLRISLRAPVLDAQYREMEIIRKCRRKLWCDDEATGETTRKTTESTCRFSGPRLDKYPSRSGRVSLGMRVTKMPVASSGATRLRRPNAYEDTRPPRGYSIAAAAIHTNGDRRHFGGGK